MTTGDFGKWVIGSVPGKVWGAGRPLSINERAKSFGIVPSSLSHMSSSVQIRVLGNSIGVEVIGCVVASIMQAYVRWEEAVLLGQPVKRQRLDGDRAAASSSGGASGSSSGGFNEGAMVL